MTSPNFAFRTRTIGDFSIPTIARGDAKRTLQLPVRGFIANSISTSPTGKARLDEWKVNVASAVKTARRGRAWDSNAKFAVSIGFRFNAANHGNQPLDVENFLKPVVDALAAGLFCGDSDDPRRIRRWDYDDSNFDTLLIHRLPDAPTPQGEGVAICVSASGYGRISP